MDRRQRVGVLSEENKKLNRKLDRSNSHKEEIKKLKKDLKASKAEIKLTKKSLDRANKVINEKRHHRSSGQVQHYKGMFLDKKKRMLKTERNNERFRNKFESTE